MLIHIDENTVIDTDRDLGSEERHVLQKLLCYKAFVDSLEEFREKKEKAYIVGWNNSGPIRESQALKHVVEHMEKELDLRLKNDSTQQT
jgi:hypothetical protein